MHNYKTRSKLILETRGACPGCSGKFQLLRSCGTGGGTPPRLKERSHRVASQFPRQGAPDRSRLRGGAAAVVPRPRGAQSPRDPGAGWPPSSRPAARTPTSGRWAACGPFPTPARPARRCWQHRGCWSPGAWTVPAEPGLSRSEVLRELVSGPQPSSARFPPPRLRPRSRKRSPGARASGRGLATLGAPRKWNCSRACSGLLFRTLWFLLTLSGPVPASSFHSGHFLS